VKEANAHMKKDDVPGRVSIVHFGGQWIVQTVEQGQLWKLEFEFEQDARDFAELQRQRLKFPSASK